MRKRSEEHTSELKSLTNLVSRPTHPLSLHDALPIYRSPGERVYVFSAIFAPSGLSTIIFHEWQHYDENTKDWVTTNTEQFPIIGGRDGGYRGYSFKDNAEEIGRAHV